MTQLTLACNSIRNLGTLYLGISLFVNVTGSDDRVHFRNRYYHTNRNQRGSNTSPLFDDDPHPIIPGVKLDSSKWSTSVVGSGVHNAISEPGIASIIGGSEVEEGRYPYTVSIRDVYSGDYAPHLCGGSLIAPDIVLTAGHCMEYNAQYLFLSLIAIGMHNISDSSEGELIPIKDIKIHPLYDSAFARNDFAIVVMQRPTSMGVEFVELNQHDNFPVSGQGSVVMGWGFTGIDEWWNITETDVLMEVELTPIDNQECEDILGSHIVHDDMLCAFDGPGKDTCYGDSGGPLVIPGEDSTGDVQIGVVSWGIGCSGDYPGVFSRVSTAYDWIREQVCKESIDPPASFSCKGKKGKGKKER